MSVVQFAAGKEHYTAAFEFTDKAGSGVFYFGLWDDVKDAQKYITTALNYQHRINTDPNNYNRPPNDAASRLRWRHGSKITSAWVGILGVPEKIQRTVVDIT